MAFTKEEARIRRNKSSKAWKERNKEKVKEKKKLQMKYYFSKEENRLKRKNNLLIKQYGIDLDIYNRMLNEQNHQCKICECVLINMQINVDHCHKTGKVRGILCSRCNLVLGHLKDDINIAKKLLNYLCAHL